MTPDLLLYALINYYIPDISIGGVPIPSVENHSGLSMVWALALGTTERL